MSRAARLSACAALLLLAACSRREQADYRRCLTLRVGMTRDQLFAVMGPPAAVLPYVPGKSLPYLAGRTAYEWPNPPAMPGPDHVSVEDRAGRVESILCSDVDIEASVFTPRISTAAVAAAEARFAASRRRAYRRAAGPAPRESGGYAPGQPLGSGGN